MNAHRYVFVEERHAGFVLTLNNPPHNVLHKEVLEELDRALDTAIKSPECKGVVITGANKCFSMGITAPSFCDLDLHRLLFDICQKIENAPLPIFAALTGTAQDAGLDIVLAAQRVFASKQGAIRFGQSHFGTIPSGGGIQRLARRVDAPSCYDFLTEGKTQIAGRHPWHNAIMTLSDTPLDAALMALANHSKYYEKYPRHFGADITDFLTDLSQIKRAEDVNAELHEAIIETLGFAHLLPLEAGLYAEQENALQIYDSAAMRGRVCLKRAELVCYAPARNAAHKPTLNAALRGHGALRNALELRAQGTAVKVLGPDDDYRNADMIVLCSEIQPLAHAPQTPVIKFVPSVEPAWDDLTAAEKSHVMLAEWVVNSDTPTPAAILVHQNGLEPAHRAIATAFFQHLRVLPMSITENALDISAQMMGAMVSGYVYWIERGISLRTLDAACARMGFRHPFSQTLKALGPASAAQVQRDFGETPSPIFKKLFEQNLTFADLFDALPQGLSEKSPSKKASHDDILAHVIAPIFMVAERYLSQRGIFRLCEFDVLMVNILGMARFGGGLTHLVSELGAARMRRVMAERCAMDQAPWYMPPVLDHLMRGNRSLQDLYVKPWPFEPVTRLEKSPQPLRLDPKLKALAPQR